jgi:hypothetical protein
LLSNETSNKYQNEKGHTTEKLKQIKSKRIVMVMNGGEKGNTAM